MPSDKSKPNILLVTRNLPPLVGGMERLMEKTVEGINDYAHLTVIGPKGCSEHLPPEVSVLETSSKLAPFLLFASWLTLRVSRKHSFDLVIGGSGLIAPILCMQSLLFRQKTLVFLHGLDLVIDSVIYQKIFVPCILRCNAAIANSMNTHNIALAKGMAVERIHIVNPGASLPVSVTRDDRAQFRHAQKIPFQSYMVFVGRLTKRKGLSRFLQHSLPIILAERPDAGLVVVGESPENSLNQLGEQREIVELLANSDLKDSVLFLGKLDDRDLEICYTDAAVQIFPLVDVPGDVEGFGMVAIEAAACGTPTVAFELGGVADAISAQNGQLVTPGAFKLFAEKVIEVLRTGEPNAEQCLAHARKFTWQSYNEKMQELIECPRNSSTENR